MKKISEKEQKEPERLAEEFSANFNQPGRRGLIGHITFAHLVMEGLLLEYIHRVCPQLGDLSKLQLGFSKLLDICLGMTGKFALRSEWNAPLRALNSLRNRAVHDFSVSEKDLDEPFEKIRRFYLRMTPRQKRRDLSNVQLVDWLVSYGAGYFAAFLKSIEALHELEIVQKFIDMDVLPSGKEPK